MIRNHDSHAANERTFLAWVRTVVAIEGFGLVAARMRPETPAAWSELSLMLVGGIVIALAFLRMRRIRRRIDSPGLEPDTTGLGDGLLALMVAALFGLVAAFLFHAG
ncbi:DUF202 domain-containing protein [Rhodovulum marinum]|uniref:Putative membrane protein n=1 Tax=Rhodovulum marinum TaxID=320662 RepID=A0A4R2PVL7_9RHOB|nr:DUF202 domain-containing protein [Rhodovulum marinum]TCP39977.1 putative membrane protein [Rhodovulum marinum]